MSKRLPEPSGYRALLPLQSPGSHVAAQTEGMRMTHHAIDQSIDLLLTKLGTDDAFREAFAADPSRALSEAGLAGLPGGKAAWSAGPDSSLADKERFLATRDELRASYFGYPFNPINMAIRPSATLASKETFLAAREELRTSQIGAPFTPITMDLNPSRKRAA